MQPHVLSGPENTIEALQPQGASPAPIIRELQPMSGLWDQWGEEELTWAVVMNTGQPGGGGSIPVEQLVPV